MLTESVRIKLHEGYDIGIYGEKDWCLAWLCLDEFYRLWPRFKKHLPSKAVVTFTIDPKGRFKFTNDGGDWYKITDAKTDEYLKGFSGSDVHRSLPELCAKMKLNKPIRVSIHIRSIRTLEK